MEFTAKDIAEVVDGRIVGDKNAKILGFSPIEEGKKGHLSFVAQKRFTEYIYSSECSVLIVSEKLLREQNTLSTLIVVEDAYLAFQKLLKIYQKMQNRKSGIEQFAFIHQSVVLPDDLYVGSFSYISENVILGEGTEIAPQVFIGKNVRIGERCKIASGVKIYDNCILGNDCIIHSNSVIGSDGFGFQPTQDGYEKIPQLGNVVLEDCVEIGANSCIDRATIGSTKVGAGTKVDNLIQIAHNVKIGKNNVIAAQAGIAGSTNIGDWNMIGGQVGIVGHINIGNKVRIQGQSGVNTNVGDGETLYGSPAISAGDYRRSYVHFRKFSDIVQRISDLEKKLNKI